MCIYFFVYIYFFLELCFIFVCRPIYFFVFSVCTFYAFGMNVHFLFFTLFVFLCFVFLSDLLCFLLFFFSLCLFDLQLLFLNTCQKVINGVGWPDDRHSLSPILYDTAPVFVCTDQLLCHCGFICSNLHKWLVYCNGLQRRRNRPSGGDFVT